VSAFADSAQIPERYIRTEEVLDGVVVGEDESYQLPVIDMSRLLDPELSALEIKKLGAACRNWDSFRFVRVVSFNSFVHLSRSPFSYMCTRVFLLGLVIYIPTHLRIFSVGFKLIFI
jgi:hypothetical protein